MRPSKKRIVLIGLVGFLLTILLIAVFNADGKVRVVVTGDIDPTTTAVLLDEVLLEPQGNGGTEYVAKVSPGSHTLKITSPYIETISEKVSIAPFSRSTINKTVNSKSPGEIVTSVVNEAGAKITEAKLYDTSWIVALLSGAKTPNKDGATTYPVFFHFEKSTGIWEPVTPETVSLIESAPIEARKQYEALSED